jgi:hypothetical protein
MCQPSDSNEQRRQSPALGPVPGVGDRSVFKDSTCGSCSNTEELIQKVILGTRWPTQARQEGLIIVLRSARLGG